MERERLSFAECLKEAQRLGYAEADPTFDIERPRHRAQARDPGQPRLRHRASTPTAIYVEGITSITPADLEAADELGYRIKLLGVAVRTESGIEQRVHPTMVPQGLRDRAGDGRHQRGDHRCRGRFTPITLVGPGAGGMATASAVVADIVDIARGVRAAPFGRPSAKLKVSKKAPMQRHEGGYYIRLLAVRPARHRRRPSPSGWPSTTFRWNRSCSATAARRPAARTKRQGPVPVILITYATTEDAVRKALAAVQRDKVISGRAAIDPHRKKLMMAAAASEGDARWRRSPSSRIRCWSASCRSRSCASPSARRCRRRGCAATATRRRPTRPRSTPCGASSTSCRSTAPS